MHIFIFNRGLRLTDNTTLIHQLKEVKEGVVPIFIFTPEQIETKKNEYFSNNSVQFMIESLHELSDEIKKKGGKFYFFKGENVKVLKAIHKKEPIESVGMNFDYTPYSRKRSEDIQKFCKKEEIVFYEKEDYVLHDILGGETSKTDGDYYKVYTPFLNFVSKNLDVREPDGFKSFKFSKIENNKFMIDEKDIDDFYEENIEVKSGRKAGLKILKNLGKFKTYSKERDMLTYQTTKMSVHNKFGTVSIREFYYAIIEKLGKSSGLIRELIFRDFYYNLFHFRPDMLGGMIGHKNEPYKEKFGKIKWNTDKKLFQKWCDGTLGIPICDAGMRQLNTTGMQHNRLRMVCASVATKLLLFPWFWCEKYFATKLTDYDPIQNGAGWGWTATGIDPTQVLRSFSPQTQGEKFDPKCEFILTYIPELSSVKIVDIHKWDEKYEDYPDVKYPAPSIDYKKARKEGLDEFYRVNRLK
jgi:deoxyribodipyrimidine photo-lyase